MGRCVASFPPSPLIPLPSRERGIRLVGFQNQDLQDYGGFTGLGGSWGIVGWKLTWMSVDRYGLGLFVLDDGMGCSSGGLQNQDLQDYGGFTGLGGS